MGRLPLFILSVSYWGVWIFIFALVIWDGLCSYKIIYPITIIWCIPPMLQECQPKTFLRPMIMHVSVTKGVIVISFTINFYCKMINVTSDKESSLCLLKISRNFGRPSFLLPASILNLFTEEFHSCETTLFEFIKVLKTPTVKKKGENDKQF